MTVEIVQLTSSNAACLDRLASDVLDNPIDPVQLGHFLEDPRHVMMIAIEHGIVVGMASGVEYFHPDKQPQLWINELGVTPDKRRRGIGRRLTQALLNWAVNRGCVCAWVGTGTDNEAAQATFASLDGVGRPRPFLLYEWDAKR